MRVFWLFPGVLALGLLPSAAMADVACVQARLTEMGFDPGPVDGQLGRRTREAAETAAGQAGLSLPRLGETTSQEWCAALTTLAASPAGATLFAESRKARSATPDENTGFDAWSWIGGRKAYSYTQTVAPDSKPMNGAFVERFEIRAGDCGTTNGYDDCAHDREHIGWNEEGSTPLDQEVWYSFSLMLPANERNMKEINTILAEFRPTGRGQINLSIELQGTELVAVVGSTTVEQSDDSDPPPAAKWKSLAVPRPGIWYRFVLQATWSRKASKGHIRLFLNESEAMVFEGVNTAFNKPVHMQYGLYRPFVSGYGGPVPTQIVYFDNVHKAATREGLGK